MYKLLLIFLFIALPAFASIEDRLQKIEEEIWTTEHQYRLMALKETVIREIKINPNEPYLFYLLSKIYQKDGLPIEQAAYYSYFFSDHAVALSDQNEFGWLAIADFSIMRGQTDEALVFLENAFYSSKGINWRVSLRKILISSDSDSIKTIKLIDLLNSDANVNREIISYEIYLSFLRDGLSRVKDPRSAQSLYDLKFSGRKEIEKVYTSLKSNSIEKMGKGEMLTIALTLMHLDREKDAIKYIDAAIARDPIEVNALYLQLSEKNLSPKRAAKIRSDVKNLLKNDVDLKKKIYFNIESFHLSLILKEKEGAFKSFVSSYRSMPGQDVKDFYLTSFVEDAKVRGKSKEAISALHRLREEEGSFALFRELSKYYSDQKEHFLAIIHAENALIINPNDIFTNKLCESEKEKCSLDSLCKHLSHKSSDTKTLQARP